jgi:hypothetical protein
MCELMKEDNGSRSNVMEERRTSAETPSAVRQSTFISFKPVVVEDGPVQIRLLSTLSKAVGMLLAR